VKNNPFSKIKNLVTSVFEANNFATSLYDMGMKNKLIIFDVGAHKGQTSSHFCKLFPQSIIHAFEPSPPFLLKLEKNLSLKRKTLDATTLPRGSPMKKHFSLDQFRLMWSSRQSPTQ
jgi:hypothetical protein